MAVRGPRPTPGTVRSGRYDPIADFLRNQACAGPKALPKATQMRLIKRMIERGDWPKDEDD